MLVSACTSEINTNWLESVDSAVAIEMESIDLQKVQLDSVYTSADGFSGIYEDALFFFDKYLSDCFVFNIDGSLRSVGVGYGRGPGETVIRNAATVAWSDEGEIVICGSNLDYQKVTLNGDSEQHHTITYEPDMRGDYANFCNYSYAWGNMQSVTDGENVCLTMSAEHPNMNYFRKTRQFLTRAMHVGVVDMVAGKTRMQVEGFPELYMQDPYKYSSVANINIAHYKDDGLIVNFEATPSIYVCDNTGFPMSSFGFHGRDMDLDYASVRSFDQMDVYRKNREDKGRYSAIKYLHDDDIVFRSYLRGTHAEYDGLQVYNSDRTLIADVDVPKGFQVIGKIGDCYISNVFALEPGCLYFYKFQLKD